MDHQRVDSSIGPTGGIERGLIQRTPRASSPDLLVEKSLRYPLSKPSSFGDTGTYRAHDRAKESGGGDSPSRVCLVNSTTSSDGSPRSPRSRPATSPRHSPLPSLEKAARLAKSLRVQSHRRAAEAQRSSSPSPEDTTGEWAAERQSAKDLGLQFPVQRHKGGAFGFGRGFYWECCKVRKDLITLCER